jgi:molybdopterin-guanine dinucleotide biosynthesis protein A
VVVVAKAGSELPQLDAERWDEPDEPRHPVAGIVHALERARTPILLCAADMPFATSEVLRAIADALQPGVRAAVAVSEGRLEPLLAAYAPGVFESLALAPPDAPLRRTVESLAPVLIEVAPEVVFNVNTPADLAEAERRIRSR